MGLDMYLNAEKYVSGYSFDKEPEKELYNKIVSLFGAEDFVDKETPSATVSFVVAYWRKANAIHKWFIDSKADGVDECQRISVTKEDLIELVDVCRKVLDNKELAQELLPPQSGFFFGSTDTDEWYFQDLEETIRQIEPLLKMDGFDFYYQASW